MLMETIVFLVGALLGIFFALICAWLMHAKRERGHTEKFFQVNQEKKALDESLSSALSQLAVLKERAAHNLEIKEELEKRTHALECLRTENSELQVKLASLITENQQVCEYFDKRVKDLSSVHNSMKEAFSSISNDALIKNADLISSSFKQSLDHFFKASEKDRLVNHDNFANVIRPLKESLVAMEGKVQELENRRQGAYAGLKEQIDTLISTQNILQKETHHLAQALNVPAIRGQWGEMQLRRVVELSGLSAHCDFVEQPSISDGEDNLRPDMIVTLPKNNKIVIDAKAPLELFGHQSQDANSMAERVGDRGQELAHCLRRHLVTLKKKSYHRALGCTPEFVVMFLPGEAFLHWALLADPSLLEHAAQNEVIIATPLTLVALLKAIAFGFKQEAIANNIDDVRRLSQQLIDRINTMGGHFEKLGKNLKQATDAYNQTLSSLDSRVLVTARKLSEIKSLAHETVVEKPLPLIDTKPREVMFRQFDDGELIGEEQAG